VLRLDQPEVLAYVKLPNGGLRLASVFFMKPYAPMPAPGETVEPNEDPPVWLNPGSCGRIQGEKCSIDIARKVSYATNVPAPRIAKDR